MTLSIKPKYYSIFFCSAYNDISYILSLINRKPNEHYLIFVVNLPLCYKFIHSLKIKNVDIIHIETKLKKIKNPFYWIYEWINIKNIKKKFLANIINTDVFFFASFIDLLTCSCINILKDKNTIYHPVPLDKDFESTSTRLKDYIMSVIYGVKFQTFNHMNCKVAGLPFNYLKKHVNFDLYITEEELIKIRKQFAISIEDKLGFLLLLDSSDDYTELTNENLDEVEKIFNVIKKYNVILKCHPRLGCSDFTRKYKFKVVESFIPSEFVDFTNCRCVISVGSISLANFAKMGVKAISLLKLLPYSDEKLCQSRIKGLEQYAKGLIIYPTNLKELERELSVCFQ
jgi:hypothetical protein